MVQNNRAIIDKFIDKIEKKVVKVQSKMASDVLSSLFRSSPHAGQNQSKGEYDANHKLSINHKPTSPHHGPTGSEAASKGFVALEKTKLASLKFGDHVTILNDTEHAIDVEIGMMKAGNTWKRGGYYPFRSALIDLKEKYSHVIK